MIAARPQASPRRLIVEASYAIAPGGAVVPERALLVEDGKIAAIDSRSALAGVEADARIAGDGCLALPGLVNAHQHGRASSPAGSGVPDAPLERWLIGLLALAPPDPLAETRAFCRHAAAFGVTTVAHSHTTSTTTAEHYEAELRAILAGYAEAGIRGVVAADTRDRGVPVYGDEDGFWARAPVHLRRRRHELSPAPAPLEHRLEVIAALRREAQAGILGDVDVVYGPPGPPWCSDKALTHVAQAAARDGAPVHTHLHETRCEAGFGRWAYGESTLGALGRFGLLDDRLSVAHGVHLDEAERAALAASGASVVTNPGSNLRLHAGVAPVRALIDSGVNVAIGSDNMALGDTEELLGELRLLRGLQRRPTIDDQGLSARELLDVATINGARALRQGDVGELRVGARGDVVLIDLGSRPHPGGPLEAALAVAAPSHLRAVVAAGCVIAERGVAALDEVPAPVPAGTDSDLQRVLEELDALARPHYRRYEELLTAANTE